MNTHALGVRALAAASALALTLSLFSGLFSVATAVGQDTVTICHATSSDSNPYVVQTPSKSGDVNGHDGHDGPVWFSGIGEDWGDIIPPFEYNDGDGTTTYPGKNWDSEGQAFWENGCDIPEDEEDDENEEDEEDTVWFKISKLISPAHFEGDLDESDFEFTIVGGDVNTTISHGDVIELSVGTYSITESYTGTDPVGFDPEDWTVLWAGDICVNENLSATVAGTLEVLESDIGKYVEHNPGRCNAENQFKPADNGDDEDVPGCTDPEATNFDPEATKDDGSCEYDDGGGNGGNGTTTETGMLIVEKEVTERSTTTATFTFSPSWGESFILGAGESESVELATGTYSVSENTLEGWTLESAVCVYDDQSTSTPDSIELAADETVTCIFLNDEDDGGNGTTTEFTLDVTIIGEGSGSVGSDDEGIMCVTTNGEEEQINDCEETYASGTVVTLTATPDEGSNFDSSWTVGAGTCTGTNTPCTVTMTQNHSLTAHFGLNVPTGGGGPGGGSGPRIELSDNGGGGGNDGSPDDQPEPEVLGEQVSIVPLGAANAGGGGGAGTHRSLPSSWIAVLGMVAAIVTGRYAYHGS